MMSLTSSAASVLSLYLLLQPATMPSAPTTRPTVSSLSSLGWFLGSWEQKSGQTRTVETWNASGTVLTGRGDRIKDGQVVFTEILRIELENGNPVYCAKTPDQPEVRFHAVEIRPDFIAFENPSHDFPTRITYTSVDPNTISAEISGKRGDRTVSRKWTFTRVP